MDLEELQHDPPQLECVQGNKLNLTESDAGVGEA